jgi:hypothetical protein
LTKLEYKIQFKKKSKLDNKLRLSSHYSAKASKRTLAFLNTFPKGRIIVDTTYPNHSTYPIENHLNWKEFYSDSEEEIPSVLPKSTGLKLCMTFHVDADHAHDLGTRRPITGILLILNNTPIKWVSNSTYGSKLVA